MISLNIACFIIMISLFILTSFIMPLSFTNSYDVLIFIILLYLYLLLHELIHGIGFRLESKNIKFGISLEKGVLYTLCQDEISKKCALISMLLPTIILSFIAYPLGIIINNSWLCYLAVFNLSGAVGDLAMTFLILKLPNDITYIDYDNSIGCTFLSTRDLSKYKSPGVTYVSSGIHSDKLINKSLKKFYISKKSIIIILVYTLVLILIFVLAHIL